ncbi:unnamed protein product, partial [Adineta steineri]
MWNFRLLTVLSTLFILVSTERVKRQGVGGGGGGGGAG